MSAIMNFAAKYYDLGENPVLKADSIGLSNAEEMQFWTLEEYLLFADAIMEVPFFYYCFEVLYWTGIREGELLALTYDDFDFVNKTISITKTYQVVKGKEVIGPPKTSIHKSKTAFLQGNCVSVLCFPSSLVIMPLLFSVIHYFLLFGKSCQNAFFRP